MSKKFAFIDTNSKEIGAFDPLVASMPADIAGYYFAISDEQATPNRLLVPDISFLKKTSETSFSGSGTTTGTVADRTYEIIIPCSMILSGKVAVFGKIGMKNTAAANTNDKGRINLSLLKNGSEITGTKVNGAEHAPNSTTEVNYDLILVTELPSTSFNSGDKLGIKIEAEITAVDATNPGLEIKVYTDPATSGNELVFYLQLT